MNGKIARIPLAAALVCAAVLLFCMVTFVGCASGSGAGRAASGPGKAASGSADTVYLGGKIYTADSESTMAEAAAVRDGKFVFVGESADARAFIGPKTKVVDLAGRLVLPGFIDSHMHAQEALADILKVSLWGLPTEEAYLAAIKEFAEAHPELPYILGNGWSNTVIPGAGPSALAIDSVVGDKPVAIASEDFHSLWVNTRALELAGIGSGTPDPENGVIEREPGTTRPRGTLREAAMDLVNSRIPDFTVEQYEEGLRYFQAEIANPLGITMVMDAVLYPGSNAIAAYERLAAAGELTVRCVGALAVDPGIPADVQIAAAVTERTKHSTDLFRTPILKFFADGVIEGHTGYLSEDYADRPGWRGIAEWDQEEMNRAMTAGVREGFQIHVHAIGDAAVTMSLDGIASAAGQPGNPGRHGITHLQLVDPADYERFRELGVIAVPQPYWFLKDDYYLYLQVPYLGLPRADLEYPMKSFFDHGVMVASGSDYPVTIPPDPLLGIQTGAARTSSPEKSPEETLWPEERVSVEQMVRSFTINGAYAYFLDDITGSIEAGKSAEMIVLDQDIFSIDVMEIGEASVLLTLFRGEEVYRSPEF